MIKIFEDSKIYVIAPYTKTGGPKSLHQLASYLTECGIESYIYYVSRKGNISNSIIYPEYNVKIATRIEDKQENIMIVPETETQYLKQYVRIRKVIWWLSWDYYVKQSLHQRILQGIENKKLSGFRAVLAYIPLAMKYYIQDGKNDYVKRKEEFEECYHLYNCEYVRQNIVRLGASEERMQYLCGPVTYFRNDGCIENKENVVVYNPKKADSVVVNEIISRVAKLNPDIEFIALKGMTSEEILKNLERAKVYFDFGFFPGPERMPREAVLNYCNIFTSRYGSASNTCDVPIPDKYKLNPIGENYDYISKMIYKLVKEYKDHISEYESYREKVEDQQRNFFSNIRSFFEIKI